MSYKFFDDIVCISLDNRTDRRTDVSRVFNTLSIPVRFHIVKKDPRGGRWGCFQSHIDVIKNAYDKGYQNILIFEDDVFQTKEYSTKSINKAINFMKTFSGQWDTFFLGYFPTSLKWDKQFVLAPHVNKDPNLILFTPLATHAYCISRSGMKKILDVYPRYISSQHLDVMYSSFMNLRSFCYAPTLFDQHLCSPHDNEVLNIQERFFRANQCWFEKTDWSHKWSKITFAKVQLVLYVILITLAIHISFN